MDHKPPPRGGPWRGGPWTEEEELPTNKDAEPKREGGKGSRSTSPARALNCSLEELSARQEDLEKKRKMVQNERLREQEVQRRERVRLDEILSMCAEYERQVQWEEQHQGKAGAEGGWEERSSPSPHQASPLSLGVHQNRIKTNGSLPRDKQRAPPADAVGPQRGSALPDGLKSSSTPSPDTEFPFNFDASPPHPVPHSTSSLPRHFGHSRGEGTHLCRNGGIAVSPSPPTSPTFPQSPRTRIRTNAASKVPSPTLRSGRESEPTGEDTGQAVSKASLLLVSSPHGRPFGGTLPRSAVTCWRGEANGSIHQIAAPGKAKELCAEVGGEVEELKMERGKLLVALAAFKRKLNDIERQHEEALRELEMERALLEGELNAVAAKAVEEEARAEALVQELAVHEQKAVHEREHTQKELLECQRRVDEAQQALQWIENDLLSNNDPEKATLLKKQLRHQQEALEAERKLYEDLEFRQLEREAWREAGREEMSREASEVLSRAKGRRHRMEQLEGAREEASRGAEGEATRMGTQRELLLGRLKQGRQRLKVVERRLSELSHMGFNAASWDGSPEGSSDADEESPPVSETGVSSVGLPPVQDRLPTLSVGSLDLLSGPSSGNSVQRKQSQDDLDRISRVTSGAPIDVSRGGSLGRRTIESLRTIERNRQIHLVQQGSQVIEEERRRVEELKRRAQDEVRAKWEEGRMSKGSAACSSGRPCNGSSPRDMEEAAVNAGSMNSIGSEESSITESSDAPAESTTSSEEAVAVKRRQGQRLTAAAAHCGGHSQAAEGHAIPGDEGAKGAPLALVLPGGPRGVVPQQPESSHSHGAVRPISDASSEGDEGCRGVRRRAASTGRLTSVQRPLTRYLPIRGQQLDLRAHMEWAGHQPDLCPHVQLTASVCRGHLLKATASMSAAVVRRASSLGNRGGSLLSGLRGGGWTRRWFVFDRSARCFSYYTDSSEKKFRCIVGFEAIQDVYVDHLNSVKSPSPRLTFCVKTRERAFHLVAPSAEAMRIWVDVIFTGAEGYTGFEYVT